MSTPPPSLKFVERSELRKTLLSLLVGAPKTPSELASMQSKHVSHVSRALTELRARGLVEYSDVGSRERYYRATREGYIAYAALLRAAR